MIFYVISAVVFGIAELLLGSFWLWSAVIVSGSMAVEMFVFPEINIYCELISICIFASFTYFVLKRYKGLRKDPKESLNNPLAKYLGYEGIVTRNFSCGRGQVYVAATLWEAVMEEGNQFDMVDGSKIRVIGVSNSAVMTVIPLTEL